MWAMPAVMAVSASSGVSVGYVIEPPMLRQQVALPCSVRAQWRFPPTEMSVYVPVVAANHSSGGSEFLEWNGSQQVAVP